jgi:hypothetical protein
LLLQGFQLRHLALTDGFVDPGEALVNHPAGADIEVTDFRISHLAFGQADLFSVGDKGCMRPFLVYTVVIRRTGHSDGVVLRPSTDSPTVEDY